MRILVTISFLLSFTCASVFVLLHLHDQVNWGEYYRRANLFGDSCSYSVGKWAGDFENSIQKAETPFAMPHRGKQNPPRAFNDQVLYTECVIYNLKQEWAFVGLGRVYGESRILLNGEAFLHVPGGTDVRFPVPIKHLGQDLIIGIQSRGTAKGNVGLGALFPPFWTNDWSKVRLIDRFLSSIYSEQPTLRIGVALSFVFMLGILYWMGRRYRDIAWVIMFATAIALINMIRFSYQFQFEFYGPSRRIFSSLYLLSFYFAAMFMLSFLRIDSVYKKWKKCITPLFVVLALVPLFVSNALFFKFRMLILLPSVLGGGLILSCFLRFLVLHRGGKEKHPMQRRRIKMMLILSGVATFILFLQAWLDDSYGVYIDSSVQMSLLVLVGFISVKDLFQREKDFYVEREKREKSEKDRVTAETVSSTARFLAHDIKRPLELIRGSLSSEQDSLKKSLLNAEGLILDFINLDPDKTIEKEKLDIKSVVDEVLSQMPQVSTKQVKYEFWQADVYAERKLLQRILQNIIQNAVDATSGNTELILSSSLSDTGSTIRLANTGSQIPKEKMKKIFEAHYSPNRGSGLGLTFCLLSMQKMGGSIEVESNAKETAFTLSLPIPKDLVRQPWPQKLLVVEDDVFVQELWRKTNAVIIGSGDEFVEMLDKNNVYDVIVLDQFFEGSIHTGVEIARKLKANHFKGKIYLASRIAISNSDKDLFDGFCDKGPQGLAKYYLNNRSS